MIGHTKKTKPKTQRRVNLLEKPVFELVSHKKVQNIESSVNADSHNVTNVINHKQEIRLESILSNLISELCCGPVLSVPFIDEPHR